MMQDEDTPIDRDAWRRVLQRGAGEPPRTTDERIRAEARRALAPHTGRWWLSASLAASLLLAVLVVQWQYEQIGAPEAVTESEVAPAAAEDAAKSTVPAAPATDAAAAPAGVASQEAFVPPPMTDAPRAPQPAAADQAAPAATLERDRRSRSEPAPAASPAPSLKAEPASVTGMTDTRTPRVEETAVALPRTPEQWYADIEALRAAGREAEAMAELEKFEAAYPGWLEQHRHEDR